MTKVIKRVSPLQLAKVFGISYSFFSLFVLFFLLLGFLMSAPEKKPSLIFIFFLVVLYPIMGFVGGLIMGGVYNLCAGWVGGIEFEVEDKN